MQVRQRLLKEKEMKIRQALERLRRKRQLLGRQRQRREFPVVSVVGYTNSGEWAAGEPGVGLPGVQRLCSRVRLRSWPAPRPELQALRGAGGPVFRAPLRHFPASTRRARRGPALPG